MKMQADHVFVIGDSHKVCDDYAWSKSSGNSSIAIVSDGCSGSEDTDIGARILVRHAAIKFGSRDRFLENEMSSCDFDQIIFLADQSRRVLGLDQSVLDATLLGVLGWEMDGENLAKVFVCGDGFVASKVENRLTIYKHVAHNGYPLYLSYRLNRNRFNSVLGISGYGLVNRVNYFLGDDKEAFPGFIIEEKNNKDKMSPFWYPSLEAKGIVAVFSDGVDTFTDKDGYEIDPVSVIWELMSFKNTKGEFVKRRMQGFLRSAKKLGWKHSDDISMAAVNFDENG